MSLYTISPRLRKLLPRLASNHDGEVAATARAIERTLKSAGHDWHDLADSIGAPDRDAPDELLGMAKALDGRTGLNAWEAKFVPNMVQLLRAGARLTEKQEQALRRCYACRAGGGDET